jgi:Meiotically up-regulated gene 113
MTEANPLDKPALEPFLYIVCIVDREGKYSSPIKIGVTTNCASRLACLQSGNPHRLDFYAKFPFPTEADAYRAERELHGLLSGHRLSGEWFDISPDAVMPELIRAIHRRANLLEHQDDEHSRDSYSWIKTSEVQAAIIEKFIASHKKGCDLYRRFRAEALAEVAARPAMPIFKKEHPQVVGELQQLLEAERCEGLLDD